MNLRLTTQVLLMLSLVLVFSPLNGEVIKLTEQSIDSAMAQNSILFLNFYADWCRFSNMLEPIFAEAGKAIKEEFPTPGMVAFGKVDCDAETKVAQKFRISKYPTLKLIVNGQVAKKEFRGQRSKDGIVAFIKKQLISPVMESTEIEHLNTNVEKNKPTIIGYFGSKSDLEYNYFENVAKQFRDDCKFHACHGEAFNDYRKFGNNLQFKPKNSPIGENDEAYSDAIGNSAVLQNWVQQKCVPLVREITFSNAEELTEEGVPFLILFHKPDDEKSLEQFTAVVEKELSGQRGSINVLRADGIQFKHPLYHLGKSENDLPVIAIDSFKHMYLFSDFKEIHTTGKLNQFIEDLHSGKLHREFHYGPDQAKAEIVASGGNSGNNAQKPTSPPKSVFKHLQPSDKRYTVLDKDEL